MSLVRFQSEPPFAGLAHLVERHLAKVEVASSSLVTRSKIKRTPSSVLFILEYGNAYPLQGESSSPDFTRKGNPQRFPFHTFPSLRGGGAARMDGASFLFWSMGTQGTLRRESSSPVFTRKGNPKRFPFHTVPSLRGGGAVGMGGASFFFWIWGTQGILRRGRPGCYYLFGGCHGILEVI